MVLVTHGLMMYVNAVAVTTENGLSSCKTQEICLADNVTLYRLK